MLAAAIVKTVSSMCPFHLANCFWATAQLHFAAREVLAVRAAIAWCIPNIVYHPSEQEVSNFLWAAAHLFEVQAAV